MPRKRVQPRTADLPLSRSLTDAFVNDLDSVLLDDTAFAAGYLRSTLLSKFVELDAQSASDRRSRAIEKWLSTETTNRNTNQRLSAALNWSVDILPGVPYKRFMDKVRDVIAQIVPWTPSLDPLNGGFSGGASTSTKRALGHPAEKFLDKADVTRPCLPIFRDIIRGTRWHDHFGESGLEPRFVIGNVLFTVPKNANIDRVACKEPDLNMFLQKSLGNQIRRCLKRVGVDLNNQHINRNLARIGAVTGSLLTLDLSSASDSISFELVKQAMPADWFYYLDLFRSKFTTVDDKVVEVEMFSSMGNGFTFELESLLFYAITRTVSYFEGVRGQISVYGDDIIAPTEIADSLISALAFLGFKTNEDKSFVHGPFRESCGAHWYGDQDVTPFYLRRPFRSVSDLILTLNQLTSWASRCLGVVDPRYEAILLKYREYVPDHLWGGDDLTSRSSLVTGHSARYELIPVMEVIPHDHVGGLLFWMFIACESGERDPIGSDGSRSLGYTRARRRKTVNRGEIPIFTLVGVT